MLTQKCIFGCIRPRDRSAAVDLKDPYSHVSIFPRHRPFLRFTFEGRAYQYKFLPFGLSLSPHGFMKVVEAALVPLREGESFSLMARVKNELRIQMCPGRLNSMSLMAIEGDLVRELDFD